MDSSPPPVSSTLPRSAKKRPAPSSSSNPLPPHPHPPSSLLPPFEPLSSSPALPRPSKRVARHDISDDHDASLLPSHVAAALKYPTPIPTSSTHILTSSPVHHTTATAIATATTSSSSSSTTTTTNPTNTTAASAQHIIHRDNKNNQQQHLHHTAAAAAAANSALPATATSTATPPPFSSTPSSSSASQPTSQAYPHLIPHSHPHQRKRGPLSRTESTASERTPLSPVSCISLTYSDRPIQIGRSSLSCDFQLPPSNRSISRVHVQAVYKPADNDSPLDRVEIRCTGWNGITVHVQEQSYDLSKGMTFTSDIRDADILVDVQGSRVLIQWPQREASYDDSATSADDDEDMEEDERAGPHHSSLGSSSRHELQTSPLKKKSRATLPPSSPVLHPQGISAFRPMSRGGGKSLMTPSSPVVVYEDRTSPNRDEGDDGYGGEKKKTEVKKEEDEEENHDDHDEERENIPTFIQGNESSDYEPDELSELDDDDFEHSFGRSQHITSSSSRARSSSRGHARSNSTATNGSTRQSKKTNNSSTSSKSTTKHNKSRSSGKNNGSEEKEPPAQLSDDISTVTIEAIRNHAVNQLAFSRLNSAPLSTILNHLPPEYQRKSQPSASPSSSSSSSSHTSRPLTRAEIKIIIEGTPCIGVVSREGKDAAGKPLESEYYYIPDADGDEVRSIAVTNQLMKPGLRSCRKQHKQYYWKKPK